MNLFKLIFTKNDCYKAGKTTKPKGIMVHSTGANNPMLRRYVGPDDGRLGKNLYGNHWNRGGLFVCVHAFIGKLKDGTVATYQVLPWNRRGWHAGYGTKGSANDGYISFEICEDGLKDANYFSEVYDEAVELCAYLCKEYALNPLADGVIICHSEGAKRKIASNHADVMHWFPKHGKSMDTFRADVAKLVNGAADQPDAVESKSPYKVRVTSKVLNIRTGPGTNFKRVSYIKPGVYTIVDEAVGNGATKWLKLKSGAGWIASDHVTKL